MARAFTSIAFGYDAFISYGRDDAYEYAAALWQELERRGLTVWRDTADLLAGETLSPTVEARIRRSRYVIYLDTWAARRSAYVEQEIDAAFRHKKHLIRISFPATAHAGEWHRLARFSGRLGRELWIGESHDAKGRRPAGNTIDEVLKVHRTKRVRRRFWQSVAILAMVVGSWFGVTELADHARTRARTAIALYGDPQASLDDTLAVTRHVFGHALHHVYNLFAAPEHWQLRTLAATTTLKRRAIDLRLPRNVDASCGDVAAGHLPPELPADAECVAVLGKLREIAFAREARALRVWSAEAHKWQQPKWTTIDEFNQVKLTPKYVVSHLAASVTWYLRDGNTGELQRVARLAMNNIYAVELFERTGILAVVYRPFLQSLRVSLIDLATGVVLQEHNLTALPSPSGRDAANDCDRLSISDRFVVTCIGNSREVFEIRKPAAVLHVPADDAASPVIVGAAATAHGDVAYWTSDNNVVLCDVPQSESSKEPQGVRPCRVVIKGSDKSGPLKLDLAAAIRRVGIVRRQQGSIGLLVQGPEQVAMCSSDETRWSCHGVLPSARAVVAPAPDGGVIVAERSAGEMLQQQPLRDVLTPDNVEATSVVAVSRDGGTIEVRRHGQIYLQQQGESRMISRTELGVDVEAVALVTSAAFSAAGRRMAIGVSGASASFVFVSERSVVPMARTSWYRIPVIGAPLALYFSGDDDYLETLERRGTALIARKYAISARAMSGS